MRAVAHVGACGGVGGQHAALAGRVGDQHVDADRAGWIQPVHHGHRGHIKAQGRDQGQGLVGGQGASLDFGPEAFEQGQQIGPARRARRQPDRGHIVHHGRWRFGRGLGLAAVVAVKAFSGFFAQNAARQALRRDDAGAVTRLFKILVVDRLHHRVGDIQRSQIKQFERPEFEADLVAQNAVHGGEIGHTFAHHTKRLGAITAPGVVDDETRRVLGADRRVPHLAGVGGQLRARIGAGLQPGDDFHHFHQGHRVEKMETRETLRVLELGGDGGDGQGRGVAGQHRVGPHDAFEFAKQAHLDVQALDHGLNHQAAARQSGQRIHAGQARLERSCLVGIQAAFFVHPVPLGENCLLRSAGGAGLGVEQQNGAAGLRGDLGDATAHRARADDGCRFKNWIHGFIIRLANCCRSAADFGRVVSKSKRVQIFKRESPKLQDTNKWNFAT